MSSGPAGNRASAGSAANRIVLLGGPGAGKGTVAKALIDRFGLQHLSTGDMLRAAVAAGTELGKLAQGFMSQGALVPDDVMVKLLSERVQQADCRLADGTPRFLLDGFPRTLPQAAALDREGLSPDLVVFLDVPDEIIVRRLVGRRTCPQCGNPHHVEFAPPVQDGLCDRCGTRLVHRPDDTEGAIRRRLDAFHAQTGPLVERYAHVLAHIDGNQPPETVQKSVSTTLRSHGVVG
ncbi:MAG: nucleoside monophosphate kinase [Myxococcales bacterium]|nr:nucleoside monophosphate kinase [Myxococcales bacterium]